MYDRVSIIVIVLFKWKKKDNVIFKKLFFLNVLGFFLKDFKYEFFIIFKLLNYV